MSVAITTPIFIIDKNGVHTTRHKKVRKPTVERTTFVVHCSNASTEDMWANWEENLDVPQGRDGKKFSDYTRKGNKVTVTGGVIDSAAKSIFSHGQCMALAKVLSDANVGTPVVAYTKGTDSLAHALVRLPDGNLIDIDGIHDPAEVSRNYDLADFEAEEFATHVENATGFAKFSDPPNWSMAKAFVGAIAQYTRV